MHARGPSLIIFQPCFYNKVTHFSGMEKSFAKLWKKFPKPEKLHYTAYETERLFRLVWFNKIYSLCRDDTTRLQSKEPFSVSSVHRLCSNSVSFFPCLEHVLEENIVGKMQSCFLRHRICNSKSKGDQRK